MMRHRLTQPESGFSLLEFTISAAILSVILIMLSSVFVALVRQERGAVNLRDAMQSTRASLTDIATTARSSRTFKLAVANGFTQICFYQGSTDGDEAKGIMVHYFVGTAPGASSASLFKVVQSANSDCTAFNSYAEAVAIDTPTQITASGITPTAFEGYKSSATDPVPLLNIRIGTGSDTNLADLKGPADPSPGACINPLGGICAVSVAETSISLEGAQ